MKTIKKGFGGCYSDGAKYAMVKVSRGRLSEEQTPPRAGASVDVRQSLEGHVRTAPGCTFIQGRECLSEGRAISCFLPRTALGTLLGLCQRMRCPSQTTLFRQGELPTGVWILVSGAASLRAGTPEGKSLVLRHARCCEVLGVNSLILGSPYPVSAEAHAGSEIVFLSASSFVSFLKRHPEASAWLARQLSMELNEAWMHASRVAMGGTAERKLVAFLLLWAEVHGIETKEGVLAPLNMTRQEIGENIGTSRETVSRILGDLARRGLIHLRRASVILVAPDQLRDLSTS